MARAALLASAALVAATPVWGQDSLEPEAGAPLAETAGAGADGGGSGDEILVTGTRATQRSSIAFKRDADVVVDGLVSDEIGATPDNSVGDTLERIVGVSADRFKGNANELSVRGLGPTLSFSTFNGREVSTAGPDRSVAFQQFPSELVNGVLVYKTQRADFLEGGVGGIIELKSMKPLDYGKRRIQFEIRGDFQPQDNDVYQHDGLGYRANFSYTDQFSTGIGDIGVSIGYQRQDTTTPEDYYNANATFQLCNTAATNGATNALNCTFAAAPRNGNETIVDPYFANSSRSFRTQKTSEVRDGLIGAIQWRPSPDFEISIDGQYSKRNSLEDRNVLGITEGLRGVQPLVIGDGENGYSRGALMSYRGNSNLENQLERRERIEEYLGGGLSLIWSPDRWSIAFDASYSNSHRTETQKQTRMRSNRRVGYTLTYQGDDVVPVVEFDNFDITDPNLFVVTGTTAPTSVYARRRFVTDRTDRIWAARLDIDRELDGFITGIKFGGRVSDHHRTNDNARNSDLNTLVTRDGVTPEQQIAQANQQCRVPFTTTSFMRGMGTNVTRWATFDNDCLFRTFTGSDDALPYLTDGRDPSDVDVTERIYAAYAMANFESDLGQVPVSGNVGLRWVKTDITSVGFRQPYRLTINGDLYNLAVDPTGQIQTNTAKGSYNYFLPSANIAFDLSQEVKLRLAAYRAIARSGIEAFGAGVNLSPSAGTGVDNIIFNATTGNPNLKPLRAWNLDASLELYASKDTLVSVAGYYKWAKGTVIGRLEPIPTDITVSTIRDGGAPVTQTFTINPAAPSNDLETRHLYGIEATASHAFTWLPDPLDGFGVQGSVNRAFANFEYPDTSPIAGELDPANLVGLSKWTASGSVWFEKWGLSLRANLRYRSGYYKPNGGTNREIRGGTYLNLSAQYDLTKNVQVKLQALNVTGTNDIMYKGGYDSIAEVSRSGTQYFFGFRVRL
jgi:TonB-dependent receptor